MHPEIDEQQYVALCEGCDAILREDPQDTARISLAWLHVIREHPVFLERYQRLFVKAEIDSRTQWLGVRRVITEALRMARQLARASLHVITGQSTKQGWLTSVDIVFVSHLVNLDHFQSDNDIYFAGLPAEMTAHGYKVAVLLIDHTSSPTLRYKHCITEAGVMRIRLPSTLGLMTELGLLSRCWKLSSQLARPTVDKIGFMDKLRTVASAEALSSATLQALRIAFQVSHLLKRLQASTLITTDEGHAWEQATFMQSRRQLPGLRCAGYQHSALFRRQHSLRRSLSADSSPDILFTSGPAAQRQLSASEDLVCSDIRTLGSNRSGSLAKLPSYDERLQRRKTPVCLVIPEGLVGESAMLFNYALACAKRLPDVLFILRMHPILSFDTLIEQYADLGQLPINVQHSSATLEEDAERASWALYRGSTAIVSAALLGAAPVYMQTPNEMTLDPLHQLGASRAIIESVDDFVGLVEQAEYPSQSQVDEVAKHCMEVFSPLDSEVLASYLAEASDRGSNDACQA